MSRALVTPPALEPLTLGEVRQHLRIDSVNREPVPDAPSVALAGAGAGNVDNGAHRYLVTFVTADGETDAGAISAAVTIADKTVNGKVSVTGIPLGGSAVTARRVYRTAAGGSAHFWLATIADNTTTSYVDNIADVSLGAGVPTTNTTEDPDLSALLSAARQHLENRFGRAFLTQTWRLTLDKFPSALSAYDPDAPWADSNCFGDTIQLPMPVLQSVTSITYVDADGATPTLATSVYDVDVDAFPGRVVLKYGQAWPATRAQRNAVTITFVAGYASRNLVPFTWKAALKLLIGHWNENRELMGDASAVLPESVESLMWPDRHLVIA